jgi:hypothetical protein
MGSQFKKKKDTWQMLPISEAEDAWKKNAEQPFETAQNDAHSMTELF